MEIENAIHDLPTSALKALEVGSAEDLGHLPPLSPRRIELERMRAAVERELKARRVTRSWAVSG